MQAGDRVQFPDHFRSVVRGTVRKVERAKLRGVDLGYDHLLIEVDADCALEGVVCEEWITDDLRGLRLI